MRLAPYFFLASLLFLVLPTDLKAQSQPVEQQLPENHLTDELEEIDEAFEKWDYADRPGCAVAAAQEGRPLFAKAYGMADLENPTHNSPSTIFEAGSVSKQFVAAAVILLSLEGELSLEDDIREYVEEVPDYGETITLRHLLTHTSGLRDWGSVAAISGWGRSSRSHDHDDVLDIISRQSELNFSPGERYSYSNSGYNLLAITVSRVADQSFAEFSKERIFEPLGMTDTEWRDNYRRIVERRSSAYTAHNDSTFSINRPIEDVHGNGGLLTTVHDLLIWNEALTTERFGAEFNREMHQVGELVSGREITYASGLRHGIQHGVPLINHTGATSGYRAFLGRYPEQELSIAILCNTTNASTGSLGRQVSAPLLPEPPEDDEEAPEGIDLTEAELEDKVGLYEDPLDGGLTEIVIDNGELRIDGGPELIPLTETEFQVGTSDREYHFIPSEDHPRPYIQIFVEGFEEGILRPVAPFDPTPAELEEFTGTFYSYDAETRLELKLEDDELVIHRRPSDTFELSPSYEDSFTSGMGRLRFHRNNQGEVDAFSLSRSRVYDMRFEREE